MASTTYYEFAAKGARPAVKMTWYDGGLLPPKPVEMGDEELNKGGGVLYIGTKGKLMHDTYGFNPRLLPKSLHESVGTPKETYARIKTSHEMNWIDAIRGTQKTTSPFEYSAQAHRDHVVRRGGAQRRQEDPVRRRQHEDHQRAGLRRAAEAQLSRRLGADLSVDDARSADANCATYVFHNAVRGGTNRRTTGENPELC